MAFGGYHVRNEGYTLKIQHDKVFEGVMMMAVGTIGFIIGLTLAVIVIIELAV